MKNKNISRRSFLGSAGLATAAVTIVPNHVIAGRRKMQPSDTVNVAAIGVGAQGASDLQRISDPDIPIVTPQRNSTGLPLTNEQLSARAATQSQRTMSIPEQLRPDGNPVKLANIYALCDVDHEFSGHVLAGYPKAKRYTDWREMLEKEPSVDAVLIATPDHNHATIAAAFMRESKHVYLEKPLCKTITEARTLRELAKKYDVVTQAGNQGHATEGTRRTVEWIQSGLIGNVREVYCNSNAPSWPQGNLQRLPAVKVPKNLNYDVWLGPAPEKPYNPECLHFNWRGLWDYGASAIGDFGFHIMDATMWALNLGIPTKVQATTTPYSSEYFPSGSIITWEWPSRGLMPEVKIMWLDGGLKMPRPAELEANRRMAAAVYYGEKGVIMHNSHGAMPELVPLNPEFSQPDPWIPRTLNNYADWIDAIKTGTKSANDFSWSGILAEVVAMGIVAMRLKNLNITLEYDTVNGRFTNSDEANNYLHYEYRQSWNL